jgi:branched-chain amino acid transport system substrate-binding protein
MNFKLSNRTSWVMSAATIICCIVLIGGCKNNTPPQSINYIKIGEYGSLTGATATYGLSTKNGITLATSQTNKKGGVLGKPVLIDLQDDGGKADQATTAVQKLLADNVVAILGEVASSNSLAAAPLCQSHKIPMVSPSSTNPAVTQVGNYIFRTCFIDPFQGTVCARFAANNLHAKTAAVFTDLKSDYSVGLTKYFIQEFSKHGKIVDQESYGEGDSDFRSQLTRIKATKPEVIFIPGYYTEVGNIAVQARSLGMKQPLMGGDGWGSPKLLEIGKSAVQNSYFSTHFSPDSKDPRVVTFVAAYKKRFNGETPDALAAVAYDATNLLYAAIQRAGSTDGKKIRDALAATKDFPGVTGNITLDKNRNAVKPAVILQVKGKKFEYVNTVQP